MLSKLFVEIKKHILITKYFRLYGSYKNIESGLISEALEDFTGGLNEVYQELLETSKVLNFYEMMLVSYERKSFMGCGITVMLLFLFRY